MNTKRKREGGKEMKEERKREGGKQMKGERDREKESWRKRERLFSLIIKINLRVTPFSRSS